jgi:DivIVA domain-containing protein
MDVQQVEFRLAFRGYNERDVDAFLDRVTEDLAAYMEENQRLRSGMPVAAPAAGAFDVTAARNEADRIVAEAREEATRIMREAEARAAALGAGTGDTRAAVAPFLNTEREFLQSLGSLVQGHAEEIKQMVLALRTRTETVAPEPGAPATAAEAAPVVGATPGTPPTASETTATAPTTAEEAFAPISVPADEAGEEAGPEPEPAPVQVRRDSGDRSLRELFWGED